MTHLWLSLPDVATKSSCWCCPARPWMPLVPRSVGSHNGWSYVLGAFPSLNLVHTQVGSPMIPVPPRHELTSGLASYDLLNIPQCSGKAAALACPSWHCTALGFFSGPAQPTTYWLSMWHSWGKGLPVVAPNSPKWPASKNSSANVILIHPNFFNIPMKYKELHQENCL